MNINFFYQGNSHSYKHEIIITTFAEAVAKVIELPSTLEVCLYPLAENVYGGIDSIHINRIGINYNLPLDVVPQILTHELIHVNQKHLGYLRINSKGMCYWHGVPYTDKLPENMTTEEYNMLPWEADVEMRLKDVFSKALNLV